MKIASGWPGPSKVDAGVADDAQEVRVPRIQSAQGTTLARQNESQLERAHLEAVADACRVLGLRMPQAHCELSAGVTS